MVSIYLLYVLKYTGSIVAGAYGVYATVTDFKETDRNGRKMLSKKGRLGIGLLLISTLLSISSDSFKDIRENEQRKNDETQRLQSLLIQSRISSSLDSELNASAVITKELTATADAVHKTSTDVNNTAKTAVNILQTAERGLEPFVANDVEIDIAWRFFPPEELVYDYATRIMPDILRSPMLFNSASEQFPKEIPGEGRIRVVLSHWQVVVDVFGSGVKPGMASDNNGVRPVLRMRFLCSADKDVKYHYGEFHIERLTEHRSGNGAFDILCHTKAQVVQDSGSLLSLRDFVDKYIALELSVDTDIFIKEPQIELRDAILKYPGGKRLDIHLPRAHCKLSSEPILPPAIGGCFTRKLNRLDRWFRGVVSPRAEFERNQELKPVEERR